MNAQWSLEFVESDGSRVEFIVTQLPCRIGRGKENDLVIPDLGLSRAHAILKLDITGYLRIVDLNSTNGVFVNRQRVVGFGLLKENDVIHLGTAEFRLRTRLPDITGSLAFDSMHTMILPAGMPLSEHFVQHEAELEELILGRGLECVAQPIVEASSRDVFGYELLGRSSHPALPQSPLELFGIAQALNREVELSSAFRDAGVRQLSPRLKGEFVFLNAHPKEMFSPEFFYSLANLRKNSPHLNLVVEIHESAVTDIHDLKEFVDQLSSLNINFAYDDFGAGQARLLELADVPAHYVKFDISLIRGLHLASERKQHLVNDLVQMVLSAGSVPLAEGVESEEEAKLCQMLGFALIQGYLTGRPQPISAI